MLQRNDLVFAAAGTSLSKNGASQTFSCQRVSKLCPVRYYGAQPVAEREHIMSRFEPGYKRRWRRVLIAYMSAVLAMVGFNTAFMLHGNLGGDTTAPNWLWLPTFAVSVVLAAVTIALLVSVLREDRHLRRQ
jgi:NADH:ubiquinone oxidoreductase subunit K